MRGKVTGLGAGNMHGPAKTGVLLFLLMALLATPALPADDPSGPEEKRIGLALSGGGYRAAAFHLGVMRKLDELGILDEVDRMSCVSGGSIAGAMVALHWDEEDRFAVLDEYLRTRSIAVKSFFGGVFTSKSRSEKLADAYDRHLFQGAPLEALQGGPELYLNATNLATGNKFSFIVADKVTMKDWELGERSAVGFPVSMAVAASSAFPPVYNPLRLGQDVFPTSQAEFLTLTDGGVYDNLGVNPLVVGGKGALDYVIISDAGLPLQADRTPTKSSVTTLKKALAIAKDQTGRLQILNAQGCSWSVVDADVEPAVCEKTGRTALWFAIDSRLDKDVPGDASETIKVGTNLKALSDHEMEVLTRHGGALVQKRICQLAPELIRSETLRLSVCPD